MICAHGSCTRVARRGGKFCSPHHVLKRSKGECGSTQAAPVQAHIDKLLAIGWDCVLISKASGVSVRAVQSLQTRKTCLNRTARAILSLPLVPGDSCRRTADPLPVRRMIQSMQAQGWTYRDIADTDDRLTFSVIVACMSEDRNPSFATAALVAEVFETIGDTVGPSKVIANRARAKGFYPAAAWDNIADPNEDPGRLPEKRKWEKAPTEEVVFWASFGKSPAEIATKFGVSENQIRFKLQREAA